MKELRLIEVIAKKIGFAYRKTSAIIEKEIGYSCDDSGHIVQLCMNNCNLMNETIPKEVWKLQHLKKLYLSNNMISYFPEDILRLKELIHLALNGNQIRVITGEIRELEKLESLDLAGNQMETLPSDIGKMQSLKSLRLNSNRIIKLPTLDPSKDWLKLESVDFDGADFIKIPSWFFSLKCLKRLSLSKLKLNQFPEEIYHLCSLEELIIDSTKFLKWPAEIKLPGNMHSIVLDGAHLSRVPKSQIYRIPDAIIELKPKYVRNQRDIDKGNLMLQVSLGGNISEGMDEKKLFHENPDISYQYLKALYNKSKVYVQPENDRIKDIKIALLGVGAVGKTSLVQRLCLSDPDNDNIPLEEVETTHGIDLDGEMKLNDIWDEVNQKVIDFTAHFWDFGGQDKYRGINRLLLTNRAIYIIVLDSRVQSSPDIWLEMVKKYAPDSRVLLVVNKIDENPRTNINFQYYCEKYPNIYNCLFKISCKYPSAGMNKISDISRAIKNILTEEIDILAPVGPKEWLQVQSEIERLERISKKEVLSLEEYNKICESVNIMKKSARLKLLDILNMCGSCIAVEDEEFAILSPNWIANFLYIFYNNMELNRAIMDYREEYIPMLKKMNKYSGYGNLITNYLESKGLCSVFEERKKIFIPMFLPEMGPRITEENVERDIVLNYRFSSIVLPEYEFQNFLVREFARIQKFNSDCWQFGLYLDDNNVTIYMQVLNDGIRVKICTEDMEKCGKYLQWLRNALNGAAPCEFFVEYVLVKDREGEAWFPYKTLEILNGWDWKYYCIADQKDYSRLILVDVENLARKCGLKSGSFENKILNKDTRIEQTVEPGRIIVKIDTMNGNIINGGTYLENSLVIMSEKEKQDEMTKEICNLKGKIDEINTKMPEKIYEYEKLKNLLTELEISNENNRKSIKKQIENLISQIANLSTIGGVLYENKDVIIKGINHLLKMIS